MNVIFIITSKINFARRAAHIIRIVGTYSWADGIIIIIITTRVAPAAAVGKENDIYYNDGRAITHYRCNAAAEVK